MKTPTSGKIELVIAAVIALGALGVAWKMNQQFPAAVSGSFNPTGAGTYLTQNSMTASQTTLTISASTPFKEPSSNIAYTMSYLGSNIEYGTLAPANGTPGVDNSEFISFTGITQNSNGSATITGLVRGLARTPGTGGCVASTTLAHAYPSQTKFILSNSPCFYSQYAVKQNNETILGLWSFSSTSPPKLDQDPTAAQWALFSSSTLVTYHLLSQTSFSGTTNASITAKGIIQIASSTQAASSTNIGSSGAFDVLGAGYATDTPQNCSSGLKLGGCVVMSLLTGKIAQAWNDLTALWSFSGGLASTASTTIAGSDLTTHAFTINGLTYKWPTQFGASSTVLTTNGAGGLIWGAAKVTTLSVSSVSTTSSSMSTTSLATIAIPANTLNTSSQIRYTALFNSGNSPFTEYCEFGANIGNGTATTTIAFAANNQNGTPTVITGSIAATTTSSGYSYASGYYLPTVNGIGGGNTPIYYSQFLNLAFSGQLFLDINGTRSVSHPAQTCILTSYSVEVLNN